MQFFSQLHNTQKNELELPRVFARTTSESYLEPRMDSEAQAALDAGGILQIDLERVEPLLKRFGRRLSEQEYAVHLVLAPVSNGDAGFGEGGIQHDLAVRLACPPGIDDVRRLGDASGEVLADGQIFVTGCGDALDEALAGARISVSEEILINHRAGILACQSGQLGIPLDGAEFKPLDVDQSEELVGSFLCLVTGDTV